MLIVVYGAAHDGRKDDFLEEMLVTCSNVDVPYIMGGGTLISLEGSRRRIRDMVISSLLRSLMMLFIH